MNHLESEYWETKTANEIELQEIRVISALNLELKKDGNQFCYLYGKDLQDGIAGFGDTPAKAANDFCRSFNNQTN